MKRLATVALVVMLGACGAPEAGEVVDKDHDPERWSTRMQCSSYRANGTCAVQTPVQQYHPERWKIRLCDVEDKCGWRNLDHDEWKAVQIGDHWSVPA